MPTPPSEDTEASSIDKLAELNAARRGDIETRRDSLKATRKNTPSPAALDYPLEKLKQEFTQALQQASGRSDLEVQLKSIQRGSFGGDVALQVTTLLREHGAKGYIREHIPWIQEAIGASMFSSVVAEVATKGIFVNIKLTDRWLLDSLQVVTDLGDRFGENDRQAGRRVVVDYSSPNVAKTLHAGHIRSTIIGHVLCRLSEACGATVFGVNHINDFGGFGFMLEGHRRFESLFPQTLTPNERLLEIYSIRRVLERAVEQALPVDQCSTQDRELLSRYFPEAKSADALAEALAEFKSAADARFEKLESGDPNEVALWQEMVTWSLADFQSFYEALDVSIPFTIGESFYLQAGNALIDACLEDGRVVVFDQKRLDAELARIEEQVREESLTEAEGASLSAFARKDLDANVVMLATGERYVVRRADGRSIYATRDLGALVLRREIFDPTDIVYVVGQEQRVHFARLFEAGESIGVVPPGEVLLQHLYFGFYIDATTRKKLSSRDSVSNVNQLLSTATEYFRERTAERADLGEKEIAEAAQQLAVGSLIFNDLKQNMRGSVDIASDDATKTVMEFERSGGAYVIYTACRARSILRKYSGPVPATADINDFEINPQEAALIIKIQQFGSQVIRAADQRDPAILVRYILDLAALYNSYYSNFPVLKGHVANMSRLILTKAASQTLINGLALLHIQCPSRI